MDRKFTGLMMAACAGGVFASSAGAATLKVPQQFATIQQAVDAAASGDTVRVGAGTYNEHVSIIGKAVSLVGAGAEQSIIDGGGSGRPVTIADTGAPRVTVAGFTIRNGFVNWDDIHRRGVGDGGGLYAESAYVFIHDNLLTGNQACVGTALTTFQSKVQLQHNRIENNPGTLECGQQAIFLWVDASGESVVSGNVIRDHNVTGLSMLGLFGVAVTNNVFSNNHANVDFGIEYGGLYSVATHVNLANNLFSNNSAIVSGGALIGENGVDGVSHVTGNSFVGNTGTYTSALTLSAYDANVILVKSNRFDETADLPAISCSDQFVIDRSNVFGADGEGALAGACVPGAE